MRTTQGSDRTVWKQVSCGACYLGAELSYMTVSTIASTCRAREDPLEDQVLATPKGRRLAGLTDDGMAGSLNSVGPDRFGPLMTISGLSKDHS